MIHYIGTETDWRLIYSTVNKCMITSIIIASIGPHSIETIQNDTFAFGAFRHKLSSSSNKCMIVVVAVQCHHSKLTTSNSIRCSTSSKRTWGIDVSSIDPAPGCDQFNLRMREQVLNKENTNIPTFRFITKYSIEIIVYDKQLNCISPVGWTWNSGQLRHFIENDKKQSAI